MFKFIKKLIQMSKQIIKGDELQLFLNDSAPLYATSHTLTVTGSSVDRSTKDDGYWGSSEAGNLTWELTAECLYSDAQYDLMFDMMIRHQKQFIKFAKVQNYSVNGLISVGGDVNHWIPENKGFTGYAVVTSLTANANTGENATYSITFTGAGPLNSFSNITTLNYIDIHYGPMTAGTSYKLWNIKQGVAGVQGTASTLTDNIDISLSSRDNMYTPVENITSMQVRMYFRNTTIPSNLFEGISALTYVEVGSTIEAMGYRTFAGCTSLEAAVLNDKTGLTQYLFQGCTSLKSLTLPFKHYDETNQEWMGLPYNSNSQALAGTEESLTDLYVPAETVTWYENTAPWNNLTVHSIS